MANRKTNFNYVGLHDEEFEELTFLLAHLEIPDLIKTANPDGGLDALAMPSDGLPVSRGFQAKHFARSPKWSDCVNSLDAAVATYSVHHVTFCFPRDLTTKQIEAFQSKLQNRHANVVVDFWSAGQLTARLLRSEEGRRIARYIFGEEELESIRRAIKAQRDLDQTGHVVQALGASSSVLSDDPYFDYALGSRPASMPAPPPPPGTTIRVEVQEGQSIQHIDAAATVAAEASGRMPHGEFRVIGDEEVKRFQDFLRVGGRVTLDDVEIRVEQLPKHFEEIIDSSSRGQIIVESLDQQPRTVITVEIASEPDRFAVDFPMRAISPLEGWEWSLRGGEGGAELAIDVGPPDGRVNLTWSWADDIVASAGKRLQGALFIEAMAKEGTLRLIHKETNQLLLSGASPKIEVDDQTRLLKQILLDVVTLEKWLGRTISVPKRIQPVDANALRHIALLLDGMKGSWTELSISVADGDNSAALRDGGILKVKQELEVDLFGERIELGEEVLYIDHFRLRQSEPVDGGGTSYLLEPQNTESRMLRRLERQREG